MVILVRCDIIYGIPRLEKFSAANNDVSFNEGEHIDSTFCNVASGAYLVAQPPKPVSIPTAHLPPVPPDPQPAQLVPLF